MRIALFSASMMAITVSTTALAAQDVVVMRRIVAEPKGAPTPPDPTPPVTPAPGPTPSPTPDPTPMPTGNGEWRATTLNAKNLDSTSATTAIINVGGEKCFDIDNGEELDASSCAEKPRDAIAGERVVTALVSVPLKTVFVDVDDLVSLMPKIANLDAFCASSTRVSSSNYAVQCDSNPETLQYTRVPISIRTSTGSLSDQAIRITVYNTACMEAATGEVVDIPGCTSLPATKPFDIPAAFSEPLRTLVIDRTDLEQRLPYVTNMDSLCTSTTNIATPEGNRSYKVRCDPAEIEMHYEKQPTIVSSVTQNFPFENGAYQVSTQSSGIRCFDTRTNEEAADQTKCAWLPNPAYAGILSLTSKSNIDNKTVVINPEELTAIAPKIKNLDAFCSSSATVRRNSLNETWRVRCNDSDLTVAFETYIKSLAALSTNSTSAGASNSRQYSGSGTYKYAVSSVGCRDLHSGIEVNTSNCSSLLSQDKINDIKTVSVISESINLRTIAVSKAEIEAISPEAAAVSNVCKRTVYIWVGNNFQIWDLTCDESQTLEHYEQANIRITPPQSTTTRGIQGSGLAHLRVGGYDCMDTSTSPSVKMANTDKCLYFPFPQVSSTSEFPAIYRQDLRTVYISRNDILARYPNIVNIDELCSRNDYDVLRPTSSYTDDWKLRCDRREVEGTYERKASLIHPAAHTANYPKNPFSEVQFRIETITCYRKETGLIALDQTKCDYVDDGPKRYGYFTVPASMDAINKVVTVNRSDIFSQHPLANLSYLCADNRKIKVIRPTSTSATDDWSLVCQ